MNGKRRRLHQPKAAIVVRGSMFLEEAVYMTVKIEKAGAVHTILVNPRSECIGDSKEPGRY